VTGVATFILLADIGNQRFWTLHFDFQGGDQRVFRVNDNVSRFPLNFKSDRKLHLRALPISAKCSTLQEAGVRPSFLIGVAGCAIGAPWLKANHCNCASAGWHHLTVIDRHAADWHTIFSACHTA
jgi:hypothetical protein